MKKISLFAAIGALALCAGLATASAAHAEDRTSFSIGFYSDSPEHVYNGYDRNERSDYRWGHWNDRSPHDHWAARDRAWAHDRWNGEREYRHRDWNDRGWNNGRWNDHAWRDHDRDGWRDER